MLLTVIMAFAGAQTAWAQTLCNVTFDISGKGTVVFGGKTVTNGKTIVCPIPSVSALTITPETGYVVSSVTYDAPYWLRIDLYQKDDFQWNLNIDQYGGSDIGSDTPTIYVRIVFNKPLAGGADEALAVELTADDDLSLTGGWYKVESDLTIGHTVNLLGDTHIIIASGKTLTVNTSDQYGIYGSVLTDEYGISGYALTVSGEGTLSVSAHLSAIYVDNYTQMGCAVTLSGDTHGLNAENNVSISGGSLTTSGAYYGIDTNIGSITISGGTVSSSGDSAGLYAALAMNITGGTVSASGDDYGIIGHSVSITGGQVTASSGGIWSRVGDITLDWTSATDYITASGYFLQNDGKHVKIADGQTLYGDGFPSASYTGTIGDPSALNGLMLRPTAAVTESGTNEYTIRYADGWDAFCDALQDNDTYNRFSGKTVKLGADITVSRMAGSSQHDFCGTFDGQGYTLTFTSTENVNGVAPFSYVSETTPTGGTEVSHPAIRNLNVVADINTTAQYASALVGRMWCTLTIEGCTVGGTIQTSNKYAAGFIAEQNGNASITDCRSSVTIQSSVEGDGTHGGFVAECKGVLNITGCVFDGKLLTTNGTTHCAGFVGYGACNITNSLYAPAAIGQDENEAGTDESATFARGTASGITIANCYYTRDFNDGTNNTGRGKQLRSIAAGEGVTLGHAGAATEYSVSGITAYKASGACGDSDPFIAGIIYNNVLYAGSGEDVSLTLTNSSGEAPLGYQWAYSVTGGATLSGSTLTMADEDVTVSFTPGDQLRSTGQAVPVSYINADGILCDGQDGRPDPANAIALDGTETDLNSYADQETWYFVGADISYSDEIDCYDDVNIILTDGYTMTVNNYDGIVGAGDTNDILTIYGQTLGTGTLDITATNNGIRYGFVVIRGGTVNATGTNRAGISAYSSVTITGGTVNATSTNNDGIFAVGDVTITGGQVTATGTNSAGIYAGGDITLGWTNASDFIKASSYYVGGDKSVNIASGQSLYNGSEVLGSGTVDDYASKLDGKTLVPYIESTTDDGTAILYDNDAGLPAGHRNADRIATLDADGTAHDIMLLGRTLYKDGDWNTLCLPFALGDDQAESGHELDGTPLEGATLMTLGNSQACNTGFDPQTGTLNLDFLPATTVEPGVAYIVKWPIPDSMTDEQFAADYAANPDDYDLKNPVFTGVTVTNDAPADHATTSLDGYVTFIGTYDPAAIYTDPATNLYLGAANKLYWPSSAKDINSFRAYFQLNKGLTAGEPYSPESGTGNGPTNVRAFALSFGDSETTEITTTNLTNYTNPDAAWYTLDGRRIDGKPTKRGLYINNGKKVAIK